MSPEPFEEHRTASARGRLPNARARQTEADDAVQEAWLRMERTDISDVRNLRGWLTTVVARICLDMLRARSARGEQPLDETAAACTGSPIRSIPNRRRCLPIRSAWRCLSCCRPCHPPSGWPSCCTTCSTCRSPKSPPLSAGRRTPPPSSPHGRAVVCAVKPLTPQRISCASDGLSTRSSPRRATATSTHCLRCSIMTLCCAPMRPPRVLQTTIRGAQSGGRQRPDVLSQRAIRRAGTCRRRGRHRRRTRRQAGIGAALRRQSTSKISEIAIDADPERLSRFNLAVLD